MSPADIAVVSSSGVAVLGCIAGWYKVGRPKWRRFWHRLNGTFDAITGREGYIDTASGRNVPALPPLTTRVANVEEAIVEFRHAIGIGTELQKSIDLVRTELGDIAQRVASLEKARDERMIAQAESAQMYRALADRDPDLLPPADE